MHSMFGGKTGRVPPPTRKLIIRKANSQRDLRAITERITLEKVLGITASTNASLACNPVTGVIAYPAGCIVVLFNPRRNKQEFIHNTSKKTITAVAFSKDGKYLVTGESGHLPSVRVWNMEDPTHPQVSEMAKGHKHGVSCVAFSPNLKYVVSVGYQHDMLINIWTWKDGLKAACNKVSTKVYAICFSESANFFVTCGIRHVKFWYFDTESNKSKHNKTLPIMGRSALLGELRNNVFCDVVCGMGENSDSTYCVTNNGMLCSFGPKRVLDKWVELRASKAQCISVSEQYIFCGCTDGIIRVFDPSTLQFIATLPKPHYLGVNVADGIDPSHLISKTENVSYADTVALALDANNHRLTCVYNDHSLYVWDLKDIRKIGKIWSSLYHSACVWGIEVYPDVSDNKHAALPPGTFLTCSGDETIRVWNVAEGTNISFQRNIYSKELMRVLYMQDCYTNLKDTEHSISSKNVNDLTSDGRNGVRTISASPDGQTLAVGDKSGNVRVYDMMFLDEILKIEAHESEVLCVEFSPPESGYKLLASAGRDRLIHIFDSNKDFTLIQTLDDHSASITSVKFNVDDNGDFVLLSCSADKSIIFRTAQHNPDLQFIRNTNYVGKTTFYDMIVDPSRHVAATACQDRNVRVYDSVTGKQTKCYKGSQGDDGTLVKIVMDNSGFYLATSCSDKTMSVFEFDSGECSASMIGHSEIVTGMKFTNDCRTLISVSGDGCIFLWKLPTTFVQNMEERLEDMGQTLPKESQPATPLRRGTYKVSNSSVGAEDYGQQGSPQAVADYRFSVGQLPSWAKKQIIAETGGDSLSPEHDTGGPSQPGGRWAQRVNHGDLLVASDVSPCRPSTLALDGSPAERKSFQDQVEALANSPLERKCSLTKGEDDDLFSADYRAQLDALTEDDMVRVKAAEGPANVSLSRGSDPFTRPRHVSRDNLMVIQTEEVKFEEAEEFKEDDVKESIIYLPPSQDNADSETARSFHVTAAMKPQRRSIEDDQDLENEGKERIVVKKRKKSDESSSEDEDDEEPLHNGNKADDVTEDVSTKPESPDEDDDDQVCRKYFEGLGSTPTKTKPEVDFPPEVPSPPTSNGQGPLFLGPRHSISARFLSRSHHAPSLRNGVNGLGAVEEDNAENARAVEIEEHKQEIKKRKEEMARAVEATRKRLEALGWKTKNEILKKAPDTSRSGFISSPITSSVSITLKPLSPRSAGNSDTEEQQETQPKNTGTEHNTEHSWDNTGILSPVPKLGLPPMNSHPVQDTSNKTDSMTSSNDLVTSSKDPVTSSNDPVTSSKDPVTSSNDPVTSCEAHKDQVTSFAKESISLTVKNTVMSLVDDDVTSHMMSSGIQEVTSSNIADLDGASSVTTSSDTEGTGNPIQTHPVPDARPSEDSSKVVTSSSDADVPLYVSQSKTSNRTHNAVQSFESRDVQSVPSRDVQPANGARDAVHPVAPTDTIALTVSRDTLRPERDITPEIVTSQPSRQAEQLVPEKDENVWVKRNNVNKRTSGTERPRTDLATLLNSPKQSPVLSSPKKSPPKENTNEETKEVAHPEKEVAPKKVEDTAKGKEVKKDKQKEKKDKEKAKKEPFVVGKLEKRDSSSSLTSHTKSSWRKSLGFGGFSSKNKEKKEDRKGSPFVSSVKPYDTVQAKKADKVQLRDKKGRSSVEERRAKAKSLGDLDQRFKPSKGVGILDMNIPPSRVVSTMDIPEEVEHAHESIAQSETSKTRSPVRGGGKEAIDSRDHIALKAAQELSEPPFLERKSLEPDKSPSKVPTEVGHCELRSRSPADEKPRSPSRDTNRHGESDLPRDRGNKPRSTSDGLRVMPNVSDLSAELSAAIAAPPPEPMSFPSTHGEISGDRSPPDSSRKSPIGKDRDSADLSGPIDRATCEAAVDQLVKAFQGVTDLHTKALDEEQSEHTEDMLSLLSATFSAMEERIYHCRNERKYSALRGTPRESFDSRPLTSNFSFSTGNLDTLRAEPASRMSRRASEASVLTAVAEEDQIESVLERYSDRLVELVQRKLTK